MLVTSQLGRTFVYQSVRAQSTECSSGNNEHRGGIFQDQLRDASGKLVVMTAADVPIAKDGKISLNHTLIQELKLDWVSLGCPAIPLREQDILSPSIQCVGIQLNTRDGVSVTAAVGDRKEFSMQGRDYVISVATAHARLDNVCGQTSFAIFEKGFFETGFADSN